MCGITGWIDWKQDLKKQESIIKSMAETLENRGPDATNVFTDGHVALGHNRLIVVDPSCGAQLMTRQCKQGYSFTIVYNGELYNTEELRKELANRGYSFRSHSDT